ncbi:MAG: phosphopantothenoylcysteine decarboxylase [Firmicutes bacterium]|nr:phosphopantothenoylcysteine decarboxylase [Bacillota bacterium]MBR2620196.1 phosphopantothenoylcysteine decarboxylase [Bacillota bacterium]MBR3787735.1 phosphopantothenoylcysteine decarboxylase [Bacillota bacterium]MBR6798585.1 phosphopantothenoylcysteine decarboxylase [Bacillota bacterium]
MNIVLGVTGSISAYKAADITSKLSKAGHDVHIILTDGGSKFITPLALQTLSKNKVHTEFFEEGNPKEVKHITLAENADILVIAPASANIIGKIAGGIADDLLSATVMAAATTTPVYLAPAMNTNMYENPIVQANIEKLTALGYKFIEPKESLLACGVTGKGALADVDVIVDIIEKAEI